MADRRRRRRRKRARTTGCLCALAVIVGLGGLAAYALPWAQAELGGMLKRIAGRAVEETVNLASEQGADFPELTVTVEEVEGDFYYQQLNAEEQTVYRELLQGAQQMQECILLHAGRDDHPEKVYEYLLYDRPELFWCDGSSKMTVYDSYTEFYPGYTCDSTVREQRQAEIDAAAETCIGGADAGASEYERIKYVFEYIVNTVDYDENAPDNQNIYSALVGRRSVCAGYSRAAQYLLGRLGIEAVYVVGTVEGQGAHAWNIVKIDGVWYEMDSTWDDAGSREDDLTPGTEEYQYFMEALQDPGYRDKLDHFLFLVSTDTITHFLPGDEYKYITQDGMYEIQMVQESVHIRLNNSSRGSECDSAIISLAPDAMQSYR